MWTMVICPVCKKPLPAIRVPTNTRQILRGGWTCQYCRSEITWKGEIVKKNEQGLKEYEDNLYKEEYIKEKARLQARKEQKKK